MNPVSRSCHNQPVRVALILLASAMLVSCKSMTPLDRPQPTPNSIRQYLFKGHTNQKEIRDWFGPPRKIDKSPTQQVWTYEWVTTEQHSAYHGTALGPQRDAMTRLPGYRHTVTITTTATMYFSQEGVLQDYQVLQK